ncbi:DUF3883 domain-containing protein [Devosia sp. 1566]|uniref:DUF3883 domain-containing protein n=1 Tax=Devosia sp. 1566 TaxID=2499144 RepID=UPI0013E28FFA|nr:DUF3883 domain-containing protein [Devosia sp. 1566]
MPLLMTWKPEGWPHDNVLRMLKELEDKDSVVEPWKVAAFKKVLNRDRVWLLKQGKGMRGIFGVGEIAGSPTMRTFQPNERAMMVPVKVTRLVDPLKEVLIPLERLQEVLREQQINTQSSGILVDPDQSERLEELLREQDQAVGGDWSHLEVEAVVADYFSMLGAELSGVAYSKTDHRRALMQTVRRTPGSIERKHQNISAVLHKLGFPWIAGYKPLGNFQAALAEQVIAQIRPIKTQLDATVVVPRPLDRRLNEVFVAPPAVPATSRETDLDSLVPKHYDTAKRDQRNRELGAAGEGFVFELEKQRLLQKGRLDLAEQVQWISRDKGDGVGYDIKSFDDDGAHTFIEVKTTRGPITAAFYLSERERAVAAMKGATYRLYRVFNWGPEPSIFVLDGPLEKTLRLRPTAYRATIGGGSAVETA